MGIYVRRGGLDVPPPPWQCDDIEAFVFYLRCSQDALQDLCDRSLNAPAGRAVRYEPVLNWAALSFQRFREMRSTSPADGLGCLLTYSEASIWVMVRDRLNEESQLELLIPYMFVDNWVAVAAGRETYGFPKEFAEISFPDNSPGGFEVRGAALANVTTPATARTILTCRLAGDSSISAADVAPNLWPAVRERGPASVGLGDMADLLALFLSQRLNFVFLRQFRRPEGGPQADGQQIIASVADPFEVRALTGIYFGAELRVAQLASHPIVSDLGLGSHHLDLPLGFRCEVGFTLHSGRRVAGPSCLSSNLAR